MLEATTYVALHYTSIVIMSLGVLPDTCCISVMIIIIFCLSRVEFRKAPTNMHRPSGILSPSFTFSCSYLSVTELRLLRAIQITHGLFASAGLM